MQRLLRHITSARIFWLGLFAATWVLSQHSFQIYKALDARWIIRFPKKYQLNLDDMISGFLDWLVNTANFWLFTFRDLTRAIAWVIEMPYQFLRNLLIEGFQTGLGDAAVQIAPSLSWIAVIAIVIGVGHTARDWGLAALAGACFLYLAVFGQWDSAMVTLASVLVAVPIGAVGGLLLGILAYRRPWVERLLRPVLDLMQTVPVFAYLVPILILFGGGACRTRDLCNAADDPGDNRGVERRSRRASGGGANDGGHTASDDMESVGAGGGSDAYGRGQSGDYADIKHGDHCINDRGWRAGIRCLGQFAQT